MTRGSAAARSHLEDTSRTTEQLELKKEKTRPQSAIAKEFQHESKPGKQARIPLGRQHDCYFYPTLIEALVMAHMNKRSKNALSRSCASEFAFICSCTKQKVASAHMLTGTCRLSQEP